ncbi:hypothetical protein BC829DRAFT_398291 [Chytridium lagenaria]|nr:hypothetical protein BC829DRAFT_398291 [Chytridium lagenaria]
MMINLVFVILRSVFLPIVWSLVSYGDALALLDLDQPLTIVELVDEEVIRPLSLVFYRPTLTLTVDGDTTMVWMDEDLVQKIDFSFMLYRPIALLADWSLVRYGDILDVMQSSVQARLTKDVDGEKAQEASEKVEDEAIEVVVGSVGGMKVVYKRKKGAVLAIDTCRKPSTPRLAPTSRPSSIPTPDTTPPRPAKEVVYKFQPPLPPPGAKGADPNAPPVKVENKHFVHTPPLPPPPVFNHPPPTKKKNRRQWNPPKKNLVTPTSTPYISKAQPHHHHNYPIGNIQVAPPYIPSHHQQLYYANQHPGYYYPAAPTMNPGQQPSSPPPTMYPGQQPTSPPPTPIRFNPSAMGPWAGNSKWSAPT